MGILFSATGNTVDVSPVGRLQMGRAVRMTLKRGTTKMAKLIECARKQTTETLIDCVKMIGGETPEQRMSRAAMIEVIIERNGDAFADNLMDELGL
jgi:fatty acid-binding protein DegV